MRDFSSGFYEALDQIMNFINSLDTSARPPKAATARAVRHRPTLVSAVAMTSELKPDVASSRNAMLLGVRSVARHFREHRGEEETARLFELLTDEIDDLSQDVADLQRERDALRRCLLPVQMMMAQAECVDEPLPDSAVVLHFMGSGASDQVTAGEVRTALGIVEPPRK